MLWAKAFGGCIALRNTSKTKLRKIVKVVFARLFRWRLIEEFLFNLKWKIVAVYFDIEANFVLKH